MPLCVFFPLEEHVCLLDCIALDLQEMDIFAAERLPCGNPPESSDLIFPSYSVRRTGDNLLKDCCRLKLKVERNLDKYALLLVLLVARAMVLDMVSTCPSNCVYCCHTGISVKRTYLIETFDFHLVQQSANSGLWAKASPPTSTVLSSNHRAGLFLSCVKNLSNE